MFDLATSSPSITPLTTASPSITPLTTARQPSLKVAKTTKQKILHVALPFIAGLGAGCVLVGGMALFNVGTFSNIAQVNAIIMMIGGGAVALLAICIRQVGCQQEKQKSPRVIIGPEQWNKVLGTTYPCVEPPEAVLQALDEKEAIFDDKRTQKTHLAIYIPPNLSYDAFIKMYKKKNISFRTTTIETSLMEKIPSTGKNGYWILVPNKVLPGSENKCFEDQKAMFEENEYQVPTPLEALIGLFWHNNGEKNAFNHFYYGRCLGVGNTSFVIENVGSVTDRHTYKISEDDGSQIVDSVAVFGIRQFKQDAEIA